MAPAFKMPTSGKAITDLTVLPTVSKQRKPRFELHLKIYDLNNVPLVSGTSSVKWHMPYSIHGEHRGRTPKRPISNHRVDYHYAKIVPLRLVIDKANNLSEYPIEFEITQEFENSLGREEKVVLGKISLNLAEYVIESEAIMRDVRPRTADSRDSISTFETPRGGFTGGPAWHGRKRSSLSTKASHSGVLGTSPASIGSAGEASMLSFNTTTSGQPPSTAGSSTGSTGTPTSATVEDGVIRRYLMQESKINSTLKIGILMIQIDGERNYAAPALKSAAVFGGIAGIMASGEVASNSSTHLDDYDDGHGNGNGGSNPLFSTLGGKVRETADVQDVYRRALAASWACQPDELPADECIEDIFNGGDGFKFGGGASSASLASQPRSLMAGTSLGSVREGSSFHSASPSGLSVNDGEGEVDEADVSGSASSGKLSAHLISKMHPIRRKTMPAHLDSGSSRKVSGDTGRSAVFESGAGNNSSGDDGSGSGSGSGNAGHDIADKLAKLRLRDIHRLRMHPAASASELDDIHQHQREDSVLSDRTVTGPDDTDVPDRSTRSSPVPEISSVLRRDASYGSSIGMAGTASSSSRRPSGDRTPLGDMPGSGRRGSRPGSATGGRHGGGRDHHRRRRREVDEYDVRDDFVAWRVRDPVTAT